MLRTAALVLYQIGVLVSVAHAAPIQVQPTTVTNNPTCDKCRVRATKHFEVGGAGEGYIDVTARIAVDPDKLVVVNHTAPYELKMYGRDGTYLGKVGKAGGGPGEFRSVSDIRYGTFDRRLHVLDAGNSRIVVLNDQLQAVKIVQFPGRPLERGLLPLHDAFLINGVVATPERIGYPLHIVDSAGRITNSFGADTATVRPDQVNRQIRRLAWSKAGFWSAHYTAYRIDRYDPNGVRTASVVRRPTWFLDSDVAHPDMQTGRPVTNIVDIQEDVSGKLWVLSRVPDQRWRSAISTTNGPHGPSYTIDSYTNYFDTIIDVIDPTNATLVATARWPGYVMRFVDTLTVAVYDDSAFEPRIGVWVLSLEDPD